MNEFFSWLLEFLNQFAPIISIAMIPMLVGAGTSKTVKGVAYFVIVISCGYTAVSTVVERRNEVNEGDRLQSRLTAQMNSLETIIGQTTSLQGRLSALDLAMHDFKKAIDETGSQVSVTAEKLSTLDQKANTVSERVADLNFEIVSSIESVRDQVGLLDSKLKDSEQRLSAFSSDAAKKLKSITSSSKEMNSLLKCQEERQKWSRLGTDFRMPCG